MMFSIDSLVRRLAARKKLTTLVLLILLFLGFAGYQYPWRKVYAVPPPPEYTSQIKRALVIPTTRPFEINWLNDTYIKENYTPFVYSMTSTPYPGLLVPHTRKAREAGAYLSYIVDYYNRLPRYSVFMHSDQDQWHNDILGTKQAKLLPDIRVENLDTLGYFNLRCTHAPGCPVDVLPLSPSAGDIKAGDTRVRFADFYMELLDVPREKVPQEVGGACCAQFAVSRERIQKRPRGDYERMLRWIEENNTDSAFGKGWVFEKLWHIIFGMDAIHCPRYEQCRCDVYGWCGPLATGETLEPGHAPR